MNDISEDGAICGLDGCSTNPTTPTPQKSAPAKTGQVHDLTVVSDVICPWCFVAKKNLNKALELAGTELQIAITWRPYELNPSMPKEGMERREYRSKKFGSWENSQALDAQVAEAGARVGIVFRHDLITRTPNTFQAHRLIWLVQQEGLQDLVVEALFRAYFTEGRDVGDTSVLIELATEAGLNSERVTAFLYGSSGTDEVRLEVHTAMSRGISGVPTFIIDGEEVFSGAMKPDLMAARLRKMMLAHEKR